MKRRRPPPQMTRAEKAKMLAMVLGALVCLGLILIEDPFGPATGAPEERPSTADLRLEGDVWHMPVELTLIRPERTDTVHVAQTLGEVKDLTETLHPKPYAMLLQMAARTPPESVKVVPKSDPWPVFASRPETMRGKLVTITGRLGAMRGDLAPKPIQELTGIKRIFSGIIINGRNKGIQFKVLEKRQDFRYGLEDGDPVQLVGYFYKNWNFQRDTGAEEYTQMPLVVGYTIEPAPEVRSQVQEQFWTLGLAVLGCGFLLLAIVFVVSKRAERAAEAADAQRRKNRLRRALERKGPKPGAGEPALSGAAGAEVAAAPGDGPPVAAAAEAAEAEAAEAPAAEAAPDAAPEQAPVAGSAAEAPAEVALAPDGETVGAEPRDAG